MMASKYRDITVVGILRLADNGFGTSLNFFRVGLFSTTASPTATGLEDLILLTSQSGTSKRHHFTFEWY